MADKSELKSRAYAVILGTAVIATFASTASNASANLALYPEGATLAEIEALTGASELMVLDGRVAPRPARPGPGHEWNSGLGAWEINLEVAKSLKRAEVSRARDAREFAPFEWRGLTFDGDERSRGRLMLAVQGAQDALAIGDETWAKPWKLSDNSVTILSSEDLVDVTRSMGADMEKVHAAAAVLHFLVDSATTVEQVQSVRWPEL